MEWQHRGTVSGIGKQDAHGERCALVIILDLSRDERVYRDTTLWCDSRGVPHIETLYFPNATYVPDPRSLAEWQTHLQTREEWECYDALKDEWPMATTMDDALAMLAAQIERVGEARTFDERDHA